MVAAHIHQALGHVRELKLRVLNARRFTGYSGRCRAVGGTLALGAAVLMSAPWYPGTATAHMAGWAVVFLGAVLANYSAVLVWFLFQPEVERDIRRLMPTVYALPSLAVGAVFTGALILRGELDLLFGTWMCLYGLTNLSARHTLPKALWPLGCFYIACGGFCLLTPWITFTAPWPMGLVFGAGEWAGGFIFHRNRIPDATVTSFLDARCEAHE